MSYYDGRAGAEVTSWLAYFLRGMAQVFLQVAAEVQSQPPRSLNEPAWQLKLDRRARQVLGLFTQADTIRSADVARLLAVSERQARTLLQDWVAQDWLEMVDPSRRGRKYQLKYKL